MARGRLTHLRIRMGPSHLLDRQDDELQAASLVEAGIPIPPPQRSANMYEKTRVLRPGLNIW